MAGVFSSPDKSGQICYLYVRRIEVEAQGLLEALFALSPDLALDEKLPLTDLDEDEILLLCYELTELGISHQEICCPVDPEPD
jgi:hypothetical protein